MGPREWLREQGIEPSSRPTGAPGDVARSPTVALPLPPAADQIETQQLPAVAPDLPDIAGQPTGALTEIEPDRNLEAEDQPTQALPGADLSKMPTRRL